MRCPALTGESCMNFPAQFLRVIYTLPHDPFDKYCLTELTFSTALYFSPHDKTKKVATGALLGLQLPIISIID